MFLKSNIYFVIFCLPLLLLCSASKKFILPYKDINEILDIKLTIDSCIVLDKNAQIKFTLKNMTTSSYWIDAWALSNILLLDEKLQLLEQRVKYLAIAQDIPHYVLLEPGIETKIKLPFKPYKKYTLFFKRKYFAKSYYHNKIVNKESKLPTLIGDMQIQSTPFYVCE